VPEAVTRDVDESAIKVRRPSIWNMMQQKEKKLMEELQKSEEATTDANEGREAAGINQSLQTIVEADVESLGFNSKRGGQDNTVDMEDASRDILIGDQSKLGVTDVDIT